jgi:hypothetical protein
MGDVEDFLASYSPDVQKIALWVREEILSAVHYLKEKVYVGWKTIGYSQSGGMKDAVFSIAPQRSWVNLIFFRGTEIDDPTGLLQGTGKKGLHVKIKSPDDIKTTKFKSLIQSAVDIAKK